MTPEQKGRWKREVQYAVLFVLLAGFTALSMGLCQAEILLVNAANDHGKQVSVTNSKFMGFSEQNICSLTDEQYALASSKYPVTTEQVKIGKNTFTVDSFDNVNRHQLEKLLGVSLKDCKIIHKSGFLAFLTPSIVS